MATWYVDPENGTDSAASVGTGDSFATRRKTFTNLVAGVLAAGDEVRVIGSPAPTSIGPATWTDCTKNVGLVIPIVSSTNATPIVVTISSANYTTLNPAVGDTIVIYNHTTNTKANGTWKISAVNGTDSVTLVNADGSASVGNGVGGATGSLRQFTNSVVTLSTACTKNIAICGNQGSTTNWTASANVTSSVGLATSQEGYEYIQLALAAGFTTGLAAYFATGTLDLSGYQQVSFWVKQTAGTLGASGSVRLRLCTDTVGAVPVHDIPVPYIAALNGWHPAVVDLGTNLNSAIQSISFDVVTDNGAQTFQFDNIIACKAASSDDSLNLTSLISKDPGDQSYEDGYEGYWAIQSINGTRVVLAGVLLSYPTDTIRIMKGYSGTSDTVTTYKRECLKPTAVAGSIISSSTVSGTSGSPITYSGGWDRTAMTTQNLDTWIDGLEGLSTFWNIVHAFLDIDKINLCRYNNGLQLQSNADDINIGSFYACSMSNQGISGNSALRTSLDFGHVVASGNSSINLGSQGTYGVLVTHSNNSGGSFVGSICHTDKMISRNQTTACSPGTWSVVEEIVAEYTSGLSLSAFSDVKNFISNHNTYVVSTIAAGAKIHSGSSTDTTLAFFFNPQNSCHIKDFIRDAAPDFPSLSSSSQYSNNYISYFQNHDGVTGDMHVTTGIGEINSDTGVTHGDSTFSWRFSPLSLYANSINTLNMPIWKKACEASVPVTFKAWFRRDDTGLTGKLLIKGIYPGIDTDVSDSISVSADTWEQLSVTVTPTEDCVIEVHAAFYGGVAYNGYVADLSEE